MLIQNMDDTSNWYQTLIKPSWAPPGWLFGPVWSVLYLIIAVSFGFVFYRIWIGKLPWTVGIPFGLNLIFIFAFTPLQFGLRNNMLASIDILLILGTLAWALFSVYHLWDHHPTPVDPSKMRWVAYVNIPYFIWVSFATALQLTITFLNP